MVALKTLIFTVVAPGTVTVIVPYWLLSSGVKLFSVEIGVFRFLGVAPILLGVLIYLRCAWDFTFVGRGTPAPLDPPKQLVISGLYRWLRNPMYLGVALMLFGEAVLFESALLFGYAALALLGFHLRVVHYEEPALRRKFGESYEQYCNSVPRWVPGVIHRL